jgi:hypothetical protein
MRLEEVSYKYGTIHFQTGFCTKEANVFISQYKDHEKLMYMPETNINLGDKYSGVNQ